MVEGKLGRMTRITGQMPMEKNRLLWLCSQYGEITTAWIHCYHYFFLESICQVCFMNIYLINDISIFMKHAMISLAIWKISTVLSFRKIWIYTMSILKTDENPSVVRWPYLLNNNKGLLFQNGFFLPICRSRLINIWYLLHDNTYNCRSPGCVLVYSTVLIHDTNCILFYLKCRLISWLAMNSTFNVNWHCLNDFIPR